MGTVVFPDAILKIFLSADENARASRRHSQLMGKGENVSLARLQGDIELRDKRDTSRKVSPLAPAEDANRNRYVVDVLLVNLSLTIYLMKQSFKGLEHGPALVIAFFPS